MQSRQDGAMKRFSLEMVSVFIAVFLALGVNEWRAHRKNMALAEQVLEAVIEEIGRNKNLIERMLPAHRDALKCVNETIAPVQSDSLFFIQ